ncbi:MULTISPECIES: oligosaccharide flippase family protein [Tenacibaculum]|uniref:oligosaccharide flippase family protein n=1 Tax=Tenacibaculum TaxID=104267 RepID=UPI001F0AB471|nr:MULTISPECIES: oligosaccharide flippase family protein [Tenacibaculum]MCH3882200.1 oligosaccharide flippase family protein [Tenacibaculum aquimarinum]MDO6599833.1 oligosaccharide flippase family protein [Tenacibaculum sp. 1_MG-2023]
MAISIPLKNKITPEQIFMISGLLVNAGNYLYNLVLGRFLGPEKFADAAIMITFLLVLSFVAMTFQLVTAKFSVIFEDTIFKTFISNTYKNAAIVGVLLGISVVLFSSELQTFFKTSTSSMFVIFGIGIPFYFLMSVNRGVFQGKKELTSLSVTYQLEMVSRLIITFGLLYFLQIESSLLIAAGILCSFMFGLIPFKIKKISFSNNIKLEKAQTKMVRNFFIITAFYELTQIIINNSDILLVKHYFESYEAGLYASLALIGRVVYFVAWMFVMLLLPAVVQLKKEGKPTLPILLKYVGYIGVIAITIVVVCYLFPDQIINILFGEGYLEITPLLWKYALATGIFAISNIFAYYYLSLEKYVPVILSGIFGMLQILLVVFFHSSLEQVVNVQIIAMIILLLVQLIFFILSNLKERTKKHI